jgi:type I restriction enzyme S subunit
MSKWKEYKLGDIAEITSSKRIFYSEYVENGVPFYRSKEIIDLFNSRDIQTELFITEVRFKEIEEKFGIPCADDILLTSVGSIGIPYKVKPKDKFYFKDGNLTWFRNLDKDKIIPDFLFTWLLSNVGKQKLDEVSIGSTQAALTISGLKTIEILLPDLKTQTVIASILSSLDDKIDLLHRQNATLEKMAETLFRQWFVEEAKEEWEAGKLSDLVIVKYGKDHKKLLDGKIPVYGSGGLMRYAEKSLYDKESVLIPRKGTLSNVMYQNEPFWTVDTMFYSEMKVPNVAKFVYHFLKVQDLASMNVGSAVPSMTTEILNNMPVDLPPSDIFKLFENSVSPFYHKMKSNQTQIQTLSALRDTLLPKLMSGELKINM